MTFEQPGYGSSLSSPGRYARLFLIIAYAYFLMLVAGLWGEMQQVHRRLMANTEKKRTLSLWRVGHHVLNNLPLRLQQFMNDRPALAFSGGKVGLRPQTAVNGL